MYKGNTFKISPLSEIEQDIREIKWRSDFNGNIFLLGGDAFVLSFEKLKTILELIREHLPECKKVTCFARVSNMKSKTPEQLEILYNLGLKHLCVGFESGDDITLEMINKGYDVEEMIQQLQKIDGSSLEYSMGHILGLAGKGNGQRNGLESAKVINQIKPKLIGFSGLLLYPDSDLAQDKSFEEAGEIEKLEELKTLVENIQIKTEITMRHITNVFQVNGKLPEDKKSILREIQHAIDNIDEGYVKKMRNTMAAQGIL
jgi:radical SAM superfamily enzyme YgiQ (UPF0313 family)